MGQIVGIKNWSHIQRSCYPAKRSANNTGVTAAGHKEIKAEARPSMIEKSAKYSGVAATKKDVAAARKEGRIC